MERKVADSKKVYRKLHSNYTIEYVQVLRLSQGEKGEKIAFFSSVETKNGEKVFTFSLSFSFRSILLH